MRLLYGNHKIRAMKSCGGSSLSRVGKEAASHVLERAYEAKGKDCPCVGDMSGAWWQRDGLQLADLYRKMGRVPQAEKVEDELRKMLIYADADHPILRELQKRERVVAAAPAR